MNFQKRIWVGCILLTIVSTSLALSDNPQSYFERESILSAMKKVNQYALDNPYRPTDRDWIRATMYSGVMEAYYATGDEAYLKQAQAWGEKHAYAIGNERSGFNRMFCAMTWLELYLNDPDKKKIEPVIKGMFDNKPYSPEVGKLWYGHAPHANDPKWVYADSLYGAPAFVMLYKATGDQKYLDLLHDAYWNVTKLIYDQDEDLYYRDTNYIGNKSPNGKKVLWARGNGWVFAGLPRVLRHLPKDDPHYARYVEVFRKMAKSLAGRQGDDGFWRSNLDDAWHYRMPESSSTAFFTAGFAWGVKEGLLDTDTYLPVVVRGWTALNRAVHPDGFMGWVQPVDAAPRPSHPKSTQEYAVGLFLYAGGQVYQLVKSGVITPEKIQAALMRASELLPPPALKGGALTHREHPLSDQINAFSKQQHKRDFTPTKFKKNDYLDVIAGQVKAMRSYQNDEGRIIDPVEQEEKYFTTPCYAHSVAVLAKAGYPIKKDIIESGMKALDVALKDMAAAKGAGGHGDFYTWPMVFAIELFEDVASTRRMKTWCRHLEKIDPERAYGVYRKPIEPADHRGFYKIYHGHFANNWNLVNTAGEFSRVQHGLGDPLYVDYCMTMQLANFTPYGMYNESGNPLPYDLFSRHYLTGMLQRGYRSFIYTTYRDILWRGAWTSLFMQSPFGELPTGFRSSHHIWNEAEQAVIFEIYASAYAKEGRIAEAGAFKRAARLSLQSIKNWIRPDGSGYIVKNRFPKEDKHGYESYSVHTCYNMLATSMLAQAWQFAEDGIIEQPCPADVGGFAFEVPTFHKVFANTGGTYIEYDTNGDQTYNPTGLLRVHLKEGHPQLGPSDGCAEKYSGKNNLLAVGPSWKDTDGQWTKLAEQTGLRPTVEILNSTIDQVKVKISYTYVKEKPINRITLTPENTIAVNGTSSWYANNAAINGKWNLRTDCKAPFYEIQSAQGANSGCELKTTLTGLKPGNMYRVSVLNGIREGEQWQVLCGLTSNKADAVLSRGMKAQNTKVVRKSYFHPIVHEGQKTIGTAKADADGTINVYTFIPNDISAAKRCWLSGFVCEPADKAVSPVEDKTVQVSEIFTVTPNGVVVETSIQSAGASAMRVSYPMLISDGKNRTEIDKDGNTVKLTLDGKSSRFTILEPANSQLKRSGKELKHRNGIVEEVSAETSRTRIVYQISN